MPPRKTAAPDDGTPRGTASSDPQGYDLAPRLHGQQATLAQLDRALENGRLAHAYLFLGPEGAGKTRTALAFAQRLLDPTGAGAEDGGPSIPAGDLGLSLPRSARETAYKKVARLVHPDLHLVFPMARDDAQNPEKIALLKAAYAADPFASLCESDTATIGIDQIRQLKNEVSKARVEGPRRVIIVSRAGSMTESAAQSSLKLIEEPPPATVLVLVANDVSKLLPTIVSRCQRVPVRPLPAAQIAEVLARGRTLGAAEARLLATLSRGSLGRAIALHSAGIAELRDRTLQLFHDPGSDPARIARRVDKVSREWNVATARRMIDVMLTWYHDLLVMREGADDSLLVHVDLRSRLQTEAATLDVQEIRRRLLILEGLVEALGQWVNPALALHAALSMIGGGGEVQDVSYVG